MAATQALGPLRTVLFSFRDRSRRLCSWSATKFFQVRGGTWAHRSSCGAPPHNSSCFNLDHSPHLEILTLEVRMLCPSLLVLPHPGGGVLPVLASSPACGSGMYSLTGLRGRPYIFQLCIFWLESLSSREKLSSQGKKGHMLWSRSKTINLLGPLL